MAITEYINDEVTLNSGECAIVVNGSVCTDKIEDTRIASPLKIVVGTDSEIDTYMTTNYLTYEEIPLPEIDE